MPPLSIEQFRCGDNLAYLLYGDKEAVANPAFSGMGTYFPSAPTAVSPNMP